ncbi:type VII secretion protein EccCa [Actinoplanes sp. NPDC049265]|uniref:type VII secretion protein EccCa n=1 Tax=Actinoplanes sp. NPDC049265 TaxID=3363902 RepID=UPI003722AFE5
MSTVTVRRPARRPAPEPPSGELLLEAPPEIPPPGDRQWTQALYVLPVVGILGFYGFNATGGLGGTARLVVLGVIGGAALVLVLVLVLRGGGPSSTSMAQARRLYLRRLAQHRARMRRDVERQRAATAFLHPGPETLWAIAAGPRLWERRADDEDFAVVRVGSGPQAPAITLVPPSTKPLEELEPLSALALRRFIWAHAAIPGLPLALPLTGFARVHVQGDREQAAALVRAMLAQLVTLHAPDDVRVAVCAEPARLPEWDWVKWLPHAGHPALSDAAGPVRLVAPGRSALEQLLEGMLANRPRFDPGGRNPAGGPLIVIVQDTARTVGGGQDGGGLEGVVVLDLGTASPRAVEHGTLVLEVSLGGELAVLGVDGRTVLGTADGLATAAVEGLARQLAPLRLAGGDKGEPVLAADLGLADLLGLGDPWTHRPDRGWRPRPPRDRLRVRFGLGSDGVPIELDLKESAQDGMGPHGLLIGATGSGKSELLRTLVLALALTHPPSELNFALIDFKGGATFARMDALPHTSAVITNLVNALSLVDRMTDALNGELLRRQELLHAAGDFSSFRDYDRARAAGAPLPEVPTLLVVCDEFSELLSHKPEFIDTFVQIGRLGRSLGVHLLLASQRLEEGRLRGLDGHLSYRIGLRTFSALESRAVIGVTDAFELPRAPGHGFFQYGTEPLVRFRSAYVSGVHPRSSLAAAETVAPAAEPELLDWTAAYLPPSPFALSTNTHHPGSAALSTNTHHPDPAALSTNTHHPDPAALSTNTHHPDREALTSDAYLCSEQRGAEGDTGASLLDILVERLAGQGTPAHQVWLPPLDQPPTLDDAAGRDHLHAVIGIVDKPLDQRRDPFEVDLSAGGGHVLVMGGPRSGKSTALRTLIASLALAHRPRDVQFYCLDVGGGGLTAMRGLPHVGGVAHRQNPSAVRRTVAQVTTLLNDRERWFAERDIDGIAAYRAARARGEHTEQEYGDVFLVVDGWGTLRKEFEDLEDRFTDLAARGLAYGVHLVVSCARSFELRPAMRDLFATRVELRLGEPVDTMIDRTQAQRVPENAPGRGVAPSKHQMHLALPRIDGVRADEGLRDATAALVQAVAQRWPAERAPRVRLLPALVPHTDLPAPDDGLDLPVGLDEQDLGPARVDFGAEPHLILIGDGRSGKTGFLRTLARRIVAGRTPQQARIILVDHRRGLLGEVPATHLLGHGTDGTGTRRLTTETANAVRQRLPGPGVTPEQLRRRSWWSGPELFVLVDDYDLVVSTADNPLLPLLEFLPQGREVGLHLIVTRRSGGAGRALFEPFLTRLRDIGTPGILLSGDRAEGPLLGGLRADHLPPGRGRLITRGEPPRTVQLAWHPPASEV